MRRGAEIGKRHRLSGKPVPLLGKPVDVVEMDMQIRRRGPHHLRRRVAARRNPLDVAFIEKRGSHLGHELAFEPVGKAPDFRPLGRGAPDQAVIRFLGFLEIFGDHHCAADHIPVLGDKDGNLA